MDETQAWDAVKERARLLQTEQEQQRRARQEQEIMASAKVPPYAEEARERQHHIDRGAGSLAYGGPVRDVRPAIADQVMKALQEAQGLERRGAVAARAAALIDALIELRVLRF